MIEIKNQKKWVHDKGNARVVTEDDSELVFYTDTLTCPDEVIDEVVNIHNNNTSEWLLNSDGKIDTYLLDEGECTQEDREEICEEIFLNYYAKRVDLE